MNELLIAIVGGTISTVLGGIILAILRPLMENSSRSSYSVNNQGCLVTIFNLLKLGFANAFIIVIFWGIMKPGDLDFGTPGLDLIIKGLLILVMDAILFAKLFFNIDLFQ